MIELKPCPFCGTKHPEVYFDDDGTFTVECQECGGMFVSPTSKDRAAAGWNNRQIEQQLLEACTSARQWIARQREWDRDRDVSEVEDELNAAIAKSTPHPLTKGSCADG